METALVTRNNIWTTINRPTEALNKALIKLEDTLSSSGLGVMSKDQTSFFSGLLPLLQSRVKISARDGRTPPPHQVKHLPSFLDRYYQRDAVVAAIANRTGILKLPTGAGKSRIACGIMASVPCTWLYLVHKANLVEDVANAFEKLTSERAGRVYSDENDYKQRVVCATFKTLYNRKELLPFIQSVDGIITDEAHTVPALTHFAVVLNTLNAYYRIGLGATPLFREDYRDIHTISMLGPQIYEIKVQELIDKNYIVEPVVEWITIKNEKKEQDYITAYEDLITDNQTRNGIIVDRTLTAAQPVLIFVKEHKHQDILKDMFSTHTNEHVAIVNEHTSIFERQEIVKQMRDSSLKIVISSAVFNEGMDVPNLQTVINATAQMSWVQAIQELGRGTRPFPGKIRFTIIDFNDTNNEWFEEHTAQRYAAYVAAGFKCKAPNWTARKVLATINERATMFDVVPKRRKHKFVIALGVLMLVLLRWFLK